MEGLFREVVLARGGTLEFANVEGRLRIRVEHPCNCTGHKLHTLEHSIPMQLVTDMRYRTYVTHICQCMLQQLKEHGD